MAPPWGLRVFEMFSRVTRIIPKKSIFAYIATIYVFQGACYIPSYDVAV
jgi:hypothetical protein